MLHERVAMPGHDYLFFNMLHVHTWEMLYLQPIDLVIQR